MVLKFRDLAADDLQLEFQKLDRRYLKILTGRGQVQRAEFEFKVEFLGLLDEVFNDFVQVDASLEPEQEVLLVEFRL